MNVKDLHHEGKTISTASLFKATEGSVTAIQIASDGKLKEHTTTVPALLVCVTGEAHFENEQGVRLALTTGDYVKIEPHVKHWIDASSTSNLILIK